MSFHGKKQTLTVGNLQKRYFGIFARRVNRDIGLRVPLASETKLVIFNLANGTISLSSGSGISTRITGLANGWYWCLMTFTTGAADSGNVDHQILLANGTSVDYVSDDTSYSYFRGAHAGQSVDAGLDVPYVPTFDSNSQSGDTVLELVDSRELLRVKTGRISVVIDFVLRNVDVTTGLFGVLYSSFNYVYCKIIDEEITIVNVDIPLSPYVEIGTHYRAVIHVYPDGSYFCAVRNMENDQELCRQSGSGVTIPSGTVEKLFIMSEDNNAGIKVSSLKRLEIR